MDGPTMSSFTFRELPRDPDGIIIGMWRVYHETPSFEGGMGGAVHVNFVKGVADRPLGGGDLNRLMNAMGSSLTCKPWEGDVTKPSPGNRRRVRGFGQASAESQMSRKELEALKADRVRANATAAVADSEKRAQFSGLVPQTPGDAHAEIARLREPITDPDEKRPKIIPEAEPESSVVPPIVAAPPIAVAPEMNDNQRAVLEMLEDAGEDVDSLRDLAGEVGVKVDRRWRAERLRNEIQAAAQKAEAPDAWASDELDDIQDTDVLRSIAEGLGIDAEELGSADSLRAEIRRVQSNAD